MLQPILHGLARVFESELGVDFLTDLFYLTGILYDLIKVRLRVAVIVYGFEDHVAEMVHCFSIRPAISQVRR